MKFTIKDRLVLLQYLPQTGKIKDIKIAKQLSEKLLPTEDEITNFGISQQGQSIQWNPSVDTSADMAFSEEETELMRKTFIKLDEAEQMDIYLLELSERMFENGL